MCGLFILKSHGKARMKLRCKTCREWKQEEEFEFRWRSIGVRREECKACENAYLRSWWKKEMIRQAVRRQRKRNE